SFSCYARGDGRRKGDFMVSRRAVLAGAAFAPAIFAACRAQGGAPRRPRANLYQCEGCDGAFERSADTLGPSAVIASESEPGEPFVFRGRVLALDGAPAPGVVIYAYHTNNDGLYANGTPETEWSRRHGRLRGWAKTGADGVYEFRSIKPAPYPNNVMPAHVHLTVAEPGRRPYWIDDIVFEGEFGVTDAYRRRMVQQGGDGVVALSRLASGEWMAARDILLEPHPV
ncbi:MAG: hypothetical protein RIE56_09020, partial [Amphiplicatus sp.]